MTMDSVNSLKDTNKEKRVRPLVHLNNTCMVKLKFVFILSEMVSAMKAVASMDVELTVEERNLLSVAYKNVIGARRASWRIISSIEQKEENKASEEKLKMIRSYRDQVRHRHNSIERHEKVLMLKSPNKK